jgi:hypothetical protein
VAPIFAIALVALTAASAQTPVDRALAYLAVEVPAWRDRNGCFSCHNNGDGARALYMSARLGRSVSPATLAATTAWLADPSGWDKSRSDPAFSDRKLARIQFAASLTTAYEAGRAKNKAALVEAGRSLLPLQSQDGAWRIEDEGDAAGSPVTWGTTLATYFARDALQRAGDPSFAGAISNAERWLRAAPARYTPDAAAVLLAFPRDAAIRKRSLERFARTQTSDGGWGPAASARAEIFDTAIVLLALAATGSRDLVPRGREFLVRTQQPSGGWPETTRPPGSQSYAQHISTTAWAVMALLSTDPQRD